MFTDKLKGLKLPDVEILCGDPKRTKKSTPKKRKACAATSGDSLAIVDVDVGTSSVRKCDPMEHGDRIEVLGDGFLTMTLHDGACLRHDINAFRGEEEKLLLPADEKLMSDMDLGEVLSQGVTDTLRGLQSLIHGKKNIERLLSDRASLQKEKEKLKAQVARLKEDLDKERDNSKKELEKERANSKASVDEISNAAQEIVDHQVAKTKLVMMKQYEKGMHTQWDVKEQISVCITILGDKAADILKKFDDNHENEASAPSEAEESAGEPSNGSSLGN